MESERFEKKWVYKPNRMRNSNLELLRIITMIFIVAHHYVVNSGLTAMDGPIYSNAVSWKSLFLLVFGAWGKTGINCFILITGYFMCTSNITCRKYLKLLCEIMFYKIAIYVLFLVFGYETFSIVSLVKLVLPIISVEQNFTGCFLLFYLCIPFINILIKNISEKQYAYLLILLSFIYVFFGTVKIMSVDMNYVSWFMVIYLIAAYIRRYPKKIFDNARFWKWAMVACVFISTFSVVACAWLGSILNRNMAYFFVTDSNTFLAVITALSAFMYFKNLKIKNSSFINTVAASAFGVLLIHANSDTMRRWLWQDVLHNVEVYDTIYLVPHAILSVIVIYVVCTCIDYLRIRYIESPLLKVWDRYEQNFVMKYKQLESKICQKLNVMND